MRRGKQKKTARPPAEKPSRRRPLAVEDIIDDEEEDDTPKKDLYAILGVEKTATADEIKKAYRSLALKWHPVRACGFAGTRKHRLSRKTMKVSTTDMQKMRRRPRHSICDDAGQEPRE